MKDSRLTSALYLLLPVLLWPLSFIVLRSYFIYALATSVTLLAALTWVLHREDLAWARWKPPVGTIVAGIVGAFLLYLLFVGGNEGTSILGLHSYVQNVYGEIYGNQNGVVLVVLLAVIGVGEEVYWRGGLQGWVERTSPALRNVPWVASTAYYTTVHIATLNPILVGAAFVVGLVTSVVAHRAGIGASIITHILWIEAIVVFFPV